VATDELIAIEQILATRIGLDARSVGPRFLMRAVRMHMRETAIDDLAAYVHRLRSSEEELSALVDLAVVAESWFLRDVRPYQLLREHVREGWLTDPLRAPLSILSLACAGGEEPYSIAMVLSELELPPKRYTIDAIDVSARQVATARRGVYSRNAFRGTEQGFQARYFRAHADGFELAPAIRARVRFLEGNALDPRLLEGAPAYDVLFCRNLLIYLTGWARARVMAAIDRLLAADGLLVIGHADRLETVGSEAKFGPVGDPGCFAYRRASSSENDQPGPRGQPSQPVAIATTRESAPGSAGTRPHADDPCLVTLPASGETDQGISSSGESDSSLLAKAAELANRGHFDSAIAECERHLRRTGLSASAYFLMGMIHQAAGNGGRAEECFHKVIYLEPGHGEALLALALAAERRGDHGAAAGFRRRASRGATVTQQGAN
jgi:chemotaxis protein methyltransferase WspC